MKLSDYIVEFLVSQGIDKVFVVSGGAIIHSIDSVARHPKIDYVCVQHEQAAAAAADAYWRVSGKIGAVMVTSGPGATNLTTSICNAYFDSIPMLCICGQVTTPRLRPSTNLRQKGFQETDIVSLFGSITKYVHQILDVNEIKYQLQKAVFIAKEGRPGPVVLDIPDDLQRTEIEPASLKEFVTPVVSNPTIHASQTKQLLVWLNEAKRPILVLGAGIRIAGMIEPTLAFARRWNIPVLTTWGGKDIVEYEDAINFGVLGVAGPRAGNFAVQKSDLVIGIGTRLSQMITGGKTTLFAPQAKKVLVDIDPFELTKFTKNDFQLDLAIESTLPNFFNAFAKEQAPFSSRLKPWHEQIRGWQKQYPVCPKEKYERRDYVDGHVFVKELSKCSQPGDVHIADTGANLAWICQALEIKKNQRLFSAWNHTPMGYALSASVGAASASKSMVICLTGDGGLMMNIQELATIKRYDLNVKVFIFNNGGHAIQKQTMDTWLNSNYAATDEPSGLCFPDFVKTVEAFGLKAFRIHNHNELKLIEDVLASKGPVVCDLLIDPNQKIEPMLKFGSGLEDLNPKLPSDEIARIMRV